MRTFITVSEAKDISLRAVSALGTDLAALSDAAGRTLAEQVRADVDAPAFDNSAMDGYAVRSADVSTAPAKLRVTGEVAAGTWPDVEVGEGEAVRIMTGAPMPDGADAVVPVEWTRADLQQVEVSKVARQGQHIRRRASDLRTGEVLLEPGSLISAGAIGMLALAGRSRISVYKTPRVGILTTGNEVVPVDQIPGRAQLRNSNAWVLRAQALAAGAEVVRAIHAADSIASIREALDEMNEVDALVISGGVSMGDYDLVRKALEDAGFSPEFWKVKQRPGKPLAFGYLGATPVFGLPGNPVSSSVCFDQYVRPAILKMLGRTDFYRPRFKGRLAEPFTKPAGLHVFARALARSSGDALLEVLQTGAQGSDRLTSVLLAQTLVHLPAAWDEAPAGAIVEVEFLDW